MIETVNTLNSVVEKYSSREYLETIMAAKEEYFELAGKISDEDVDFESRMNGFNYWYVSQRLIESGKTFLEEYLATTELDEKTTDSLKNINHSLFEYRGLSFSKKHVLFDILHDKKITIPKDDFNFQLIKDDIFIARNLEYNGVYNMLDDVSVLPVEIKSTLVKESKKVRKLQDKKRDLQFLMTVEKLKTKWRRYGHIEAKKIFQFNF